MELGRNIISQHRCTATLCSVSCQLSASTMEVRFFNLGTYMVSITKPTSTGWNFRFGRRAGETVDSELQEESGCFYWLRLQMGLVGGA